LTIIAVGLVIVTFTAKSLAGRARRRLPPAELSGLSPYELAFLAGGPRRAANTVLTVLARAGAIRVARGGWITPVYGAAPSPVPLEQAVLDVLSHGGSRASDLRGALGAHPAMGGVIGSLHARRLLVSSPSGKIGAMAAIVVVTALFDLGVVMLHPSVGALIFGGLALLVGLVALAGLARPFENVLTSDAVRLLAQERRRHRRTGSSDLAFPVAVHGLAASGDPVLVTELSTSDPGSDCRGSCGAGSSCGSGSSCSSSSSSCSSSSSSCSSGSSCGSSSS
jgi:uncharacterized protein (TIGR04222 family)